MGVVVNYGATAESEAALAMAVEEAARRGVDLHILADSEEAAGELRERIARGGENWHLHELPAHQGVANAVLDLATEVGAGLIVVGGRRRSPVGKLFLGSVAQEILLAAEVPVVLVKP
jgi:nucleotide-binding universal stress UspA family protein